jgi:SAM-dependent methyltransferase
VTTNREVFDEIAESWYRVRHWPLLRDDLDALAARWQGGKLLNVGCAHGPDFLSFRQGFELYGVDSSPAMVRQAIGYSGKFNFYVNLAICDALSLPFADDVFDRAISVATYHHIRGRQERQKAFTELRRVLKTEGEAFLTVWNWGQPRFWLKPREQWIPWKLKERTVYRYYHLFSYGELRRLLVRSGWKIISMSPEKSYRLPVRSFSRNICVLMRKESSAETRPV